MEQFLDLQHQMMLAYLQLRPAAEGLPEAPSSEPARAPAEETAVAPPPAAAVETLVVSDTAVTPASSPEPEASHAVSVATGYGRFGITVVPRPLSGERASLARDQTIVVTEFGRGDGHDVARRVVERLALNGRQVVTIAIGGDSDLPGAVLGSPVDTAAEAERIVAVIEERYGPVAALVHLAPLSSLPPFEALDAESVWERLCVETKTFFLLAKALGPNLERAAAEGGAAIIAGTTMGGALGHSAASATMFPGQGGVVGFAKSLALEWPAIRVRAVDLDSADTSDALAGRIVDELWADDRHAEVGYLEGRRIGLDVVAAPVMAVPAFDLPSDAVILATGGARGITADVCLDLAERYQPTLVLVGQSSLPESESPETAKYQEPTDLKRVLTDRLRSTGVRVTPAMVERAFQQLAKEREIRANLGALTATGARVHYVRLDVRDDDAFGALITDIYQTYGRLDGVIHGAGIIEDKLVRDKSLESFERVFRTKSAGAFALARHLRGDSLKFLVFFSSVAGRFGNRGQADYAAANEVVSKLALALQRRWPARVCAIDWAPWDKHGMVSPELKREFARRGVELISPEAGRRAFWDEIQQDPHADGEVVIGGSAPASLTRPAPAPPPAEESTPLLKHATREASQPGTVRFTRTLDVSIDRYLNDHRLDEHPVLPLAVATELMAEAVQAVWPDLTVVAVRSLQLFKGIVVDEGPLPLVITVRASVHSNDEGLTEADVEIAVPSRKPPVRYRAVVQLGTRLPEAPPFDPPARPLTPLPMSLERAYREWTFHGPMFQRLTSVEGIGSDSLIGTIHSPSTIPVIGGVGRPRWIIDPFVFDAALQLLLVWSRSQNDKTALPTRFFTFRRYRALSDLPLTCYIAVESTAGGHALRSDVHFVDAEGRLVGVLEGMEASCSAALNRLAGPNPAVASVHL
jgi:NAD(P)-dependent dehydrogenase (short-subunit alcohol dehydrogenase family)